ncbi:MAG: MATE family efflux transporter [Erysipelotrichaceae bacterium]
MEILQKNTKKLYQTYLFAAFGSALVGAIYSLADMAIIGHFEGPAGTAAMAIVLPVWTIIISLGLLTGIGGSILYSNTKAKALDKANAVFSVACGLTLVIACIVWGLICAFDVELLTMLGAQGDLLDMALRYLGPLKLVIPFVMVSQLLVAFLRNDNNPQLATFAVVSTALLNIVLDYVFVFSFGMGIGGAAIATAISNVLAFVIVCLHFFRKQNTLRFCIPTNIRSTAQAIVTLGFSTFFVDIAMGLMILLFNHQILRYFDETTLAIYGALSSLVLIVQCTSYSIGQASQPLLSLNLGAKQLGRVRDFRRYAIFSAIAFGLFWGVLTLWIPELIIQVFMKTTPEVLAQAPSILRTYGLAFFLTPMNLFFTYYFQSMLEPKKAMIIAIGRGLVLGACFLFVLPQVLGIDALWLAMPLCELCILAVGTKWMFESKRQLQLNYAG